MDNFRLHDNGLDLNGLQFRQVLTVKELAFYLMCNSKTIYNLVENEEIPYFRIGRSIRFRLNQIEDWMNGKAS
jgi:excisionase family DNA binding protein